MTKQENMLKQIENLKCLKKLRRTKRQLEWYASKQGLEWTDGLTVAIDKAIELHESNITRLTA